MKTRKWMSAAVVFVLAASWQYRPWPDPGGDGAATASRPIIAAEVKKGDAVLKLRDDNGYPAWAGWRR